MINRVVIVGRLTKDPELRYTPNGNAVAKFTVASNRPFSDQNGERQADFINCVTWRRQAENLANYMSKGNLVGVDGRIQTRNFDNQEGQKIFITEVLAESIQFLETKSGSNNGQGNNNKPQENNQNQGNNNNGFQDNGEPIDISDDDLPF